MERVEPPRGRTVRGFIAQLAHLKLVFLQGSAPNFSRYETGGSNPAGVKVVQTCVNAHSGAREPQKREPSRHAAKNQNVGQRYFRASLSRPPVHSSHLCRMCVDKDLLPTTSRKHPGQIPFIKRVEVRTKRKRHDARKMRTFSCSTKQLLPTSGSLELYDHPAQTRNFKQVKVSLLTVQTVATSGQCGAILAGIRGGAKSMRPNRPSHEAHLFAQRALFFQLTKLKGHFKSCRHDASEPELIKSTYYQGRLERALAIGPNHEK